MANQPRSLAGTLDIPASQKGARFVRFCDAFNLPIVTFVDTPGFLPGKDLEWRGMIRHGAELVFAYAEATVPRLAVTLRKAMGGAYIVMDSKGLGSTLCLAWPGAQPAVMGARGAVQILHRSAGPEERAELEADYAARFLAPWEATERGFYDMVIDPADTRRELARRVAQRVRPAGAPGRPEARRRAPCETRPLTRENARRDGVCAREQGSFRTSPNRNRAEVDLSLLSGKIGVWNRPLRFRWCSSRATAHGCSTPAACASAAS